MKNENDQDLEIQSNEQAVTDTVSSAPERPSWQPYYEAAQQLYDAGDIEQAEAYYAYAQQLYELEDEPIEEPAAAAQDTYAETEQAEEIPAQQSIAPAGDERCESEQPSEIPQANPPLSSVQPAPPSTDVPQQQASYSEAPLASVQPTPPSVDAIQQQEAPLASVQPAPQGVNIPQQQPRYSEAPLASIQPVPFSANAPQQPASYSENIYDLNSIPPSAVSVPPTQQQPDPVNTAVSTTPDPLTSWAAEYAGDDLDDDTFMVRPNRPRKRRMVIFSAIGLVALVGGFGILQGKNMFSSSKITTTTSYITPVTSSDPIATPSPSKPAESPAKAIERASAASSAPQMAKPEGKDSFYQPKSWASSARKAASKASVRKSKRKAKAAKRRKARNARRSRVAKKKKSSSKGLSNDPLSNIDL
ncbi:MAG: hypothetical protein QNJ97_14325 [Myxococcota bacterium]|nr:hypothetical protein [Myxococcota bacterium]